MLMAHLLATGMKHVVKRRVDRTRPYVVVDGGEYEMEAGDGKAPEVNSFPSGHTAGAVAVAQACGREFPEHGVAAASAAAAVALIQIPRCAHYPSDLAAGAAIGSLAEASVALIGEPLLQWIEAVAQNRADRLGSPQRA
jgi:undecaprenyl-diphosphatase